MDGLSYAERGIKCTLYWPDGTRKTPSRSHQDVIRNWTYQLAQALMDEYNEEHHLPEVSSLSLPSVPTLCRASTMLYFLIHPSHNITY
jgi:hypothetical protein